MTIKNTKYNIDVTTYVLGLLEGYITQDEFELVHNCLEKRVWALEQGPMDGLLSSRWKWKSNTSNYGLWFTGSFTRNYHTRIRS